MGIAFAVFIGLIAALTVRLLAPAWYRGHLATVLAVGLLGAAAAFVAGRAVGFGRTADYLLASLGAFAVLLPLALVHYLVELGHR